MECQCTKQNIFASQSICMGVSVSLSCLFVHEPPYQTTLVCCIPVFRRCLSRMDHPTIFTYVSFHVRVGLAQTRPNYHHTHHNSPSTHTSFISISSGRMAQPTTLIYTVSHALHYVHGRPMRIHYQLHQMFCHLQLLFLIECSYWFVNSRQHLPFAYLKANQMFVALM